MQRIKDIIEQSGALSGRLFDLTIQLLIVLLLISFAVETLPPGNAMIPTRGGATAAPC